MYPSYKKLIKSSILSNQILGAVLIGIYCLVYGLTAQVLLTGIQLVFFLSSLIFALSVFYVRDKNSQKEKVKRGIFFNQMIGLTLVFAYIVVYGATSFALLSGFQLIFFMSSYTFALSLFYLRDPERIKKQQEEIDATASFSYSAEKFPCFINNQDLSWLVRTLNNNLSTIIGFCELMLRRDYNEQEKQYMLRNIYDNATSMAHSISKVAAIVPDDLSGPKEDSKEKTDDEVAASF